MNFIQKKSLKLIKQQAAMQIIYKYSNLKQNLIVRNISFANANKNISH